MMKWGPGLVLVCAVATAAEAQVGGFISANAAAQWPAAGEFTQTGTGPLRQEAATLTAAQDFGAALTFDVGTGVLYSLGAGWQAGAGVAWSRYRDTQPAALTVTLPHPIVFRRPSTASATSDETLTRRETATHLHAMLASSVGRVTIRLSAGPSRLRLTQQLVSDVAVSETLGLSPALPYALNITGNQAREATAVAWGSHVAADVGVFLTKHLGIGGIARYTRASVDVPNALQNTIDGTATATSRVRVGGLSAGAGLRVRF